MWAIAVVIVVALAPAPAFGDDDPSRAAPERTSDGVSTADAHTSPAGMSPDGVSIAGEPTSSPDGVSTTGEPELPDAVSTASEPEPPAVSTTGSGDARGFGAGRIALRGATEIGKTSSLALDGWYALNERFRLGITMSNDARRQLAAGRGLCLRACAERFAGVAAEAQIRLDDLLVGRAAIDTTRFGPTAAAIELGADAHIAHGAVTARVSPVLRLGIARRDLSNTDSAAVLGQLGVRVWPTGGGLACVRAGVLLDDLKATPSVGAAAGIWLELGAITVTGRFGTAELARTRSTDSLFADLAVTWAN